MTTTLSLRLALAVVVSTTVMSACSAPAPGVAPAPSATAARQNTRTAVDMAGRSVKVPAQIDRIGTNYPALTQMIFMLGGADRIVATSQNLAATVPLFVTMYPRLTQISAPFGSADVNVEQLLSQRPDVVFLSSGSQALIPTLDQVGIPALVAASFKDPDELKAGVKFVGSVLGDSTAARAQQFADYYDANISRVVSATATIPADQRPKVYYTADAPLTTEGQHTIVERWMAQAGGRNIAAENGISTAPAFAAVTFEDVFGWNPDIIIVRDPSTRRAIFDDQRWRSISAVKNDRVLANPRGVFVWSVRSGEAALQPLWAATIFHPDRFRDLDMRKEVKNFYQRFYGYALSDPQLDDILNPSVP